METLGLLLAAVGGIGYLICHIIVIVKMFQHGQIGLGIACIVLSFCCGIGFLITLVYGWVKASEWAINNIMLIYTLCVILAIVGNVMNPAQITRFQEQIQQRK